jgi:hypothetical protein
MSAAEYYNDPRYRPRQSHYGDPRPGSSNRQHMGVVSRPGPEVHEDSPIEEVQRDFPPGEYAYGHYPKRRSRRHPSGQYMTTSAPRARSAHGRDSRYPDDYYYHDRHPRSDHYRRSRRDDPRRTYYVDEGTR